MHARGVRRTWPDSGNALTAAQARKFSLSPSNLLVTSRRAARGSTALAFESGRGWRATLDASTPCANRKDYLHCELSLGKATTFCTKRRPGNTCSTPALRNGNEPGHHREQPDRPSQRQSPRRLACVRVRRPAADVRAARRAVVRASRVRGSLPSGRLPRLIDAPAALWFPEARTPRRIRAFLFFFHFGCVPALRRRIDAWRTRRGMCAAGNPHRAARRHFRREGSRGGTAEVEAINPKSRRRSRRATQTGRNDWAAPEPVTGTFSFGSTSRSVVRPLLSACHQTDQEETDHGTRIRRPRQLSRRSGRASVVAATRPGRASSAATASSVATRNCARSPAATIRACAQRRGVSGTAA